VWLANTASLLLPVSNLTNLLAVDRLGLTATQYTTKVAPASLVAVVVTAVLLALWHRRSIRGRYEVPDVMRPGDPVLFLGAAGACLLLVPAGAASASAIVVVSFALWRKRSLPTFALVPWRLVLLVEALFLVVEAVGPHGWTTCSGTASAARCRRRSSPRAGPTSSTTSRPTWPSSGLSPTTSCCCRCCSA